MTLELGRLILFPGVAGKWLVNNYDSNRSWMGSNLNKVAPILHKYIVCSGKGYHYNRSKETYVYPNVSMT